MIVIVDYGMGNLGSVYNILRRIGVESTVSSDISVIRAAQKLILPGVGSFDNGVASLERLGIAAVIRETVLEKGVPILGICLGMQLLGKRSEEGKREGLGLIDAETVRFQILAEARHLKVPHMGWNRAFPVKESPLFSGMHDDARFYFVHSYHVVCRNDGDVLAKTRHGIEFTSAVERGHIRGVQFHPEKSHKFGMKLLGNFSVI